MSLGLMIEVRIKVMMRISMVSFLLLRLGSASSKTIRTTEKILNFPPDRP